MNHAAMRHVDAKAATMTDEGNIEYWTCADCGRYFLDEAGEKEIGETDIVLEKLPEQPQPEESKPEEPKPDDKTPRTGDDGRRNVDGARRGCHRRGRRARDR